MPRTRVAVEAGARKAFAIAVDWPGWTRSGKSEPEALEKLVAYASRYKRSIGSAAKSVAIPASADDLEIVERLKGDAGTDYGVPSATAKVDSKLASEKELEQQLRMLKAAWRAFEKAADDAQGKELAKGPRGGGRTLAKIRDHVIEAEGAYMGALGAKTPPLSVGWQGLHDVMIEALHAKLRGELPDRGPRGGERWPAAYAIRRSAWHALDHAWEVEDRSP